MTNVINLKQYRDERNGPMIDVSIPEYQAPLFNSVSILYHGRSIQGQHNKWESIPIIYYDGDVDNAVTKLSGLELKAMFGAKTKTTRWDQAVFSDRTKYKEA